MVWGNPGRSGGRSSLVDGAGLVAGAGSLMGSDLDKPTWTIVGALTMVIFFLIEADMWEARGAGSATAQRIVTRLVQRGAT